MVMFVDGGCRRNGYSNAIGAAACIIISKYGKSQGWYREIPTHLNPTSQRAELSALILALETAIERYEESHTNPYMDVTIHMDSRYAHDCITEWVYKRVGNGWKNAKGYEVANRDLIEEASDLDDRLKALGAVTYTWWVLSNCMTSMYPEDFYSIYV